MAGNSSWTNRQASIPGGVRQADIHQDEIRDELPRLGDGLRARAGLGDDFELAVPIQKGDQPLPNHLVIIDDPPLSSREPIPQQS